MQAELNFLGRNKFNLHGGHLVKSFSKGPMYMTSDLVNSLPGKFTLKKCTKVIKLYVQQCSLY